MQIALTKADIQSLYAMFVMLEKALEKNIDKGPISAMQELANKIERQTDISFQEVKEYLKEDVRESGLII